MTENAEGPRGAPVGLVLDIRSERPEDRPAIRALVAAAFGPDDDTQDFVEAVRALVAGALTGTTIVADLPAVIAPTGPPRL
jgi:predicted N-acetyltransferase YhbS